MTGNAAPLPGNDALSLVNLLEVERVDEDLFRAGLLFEEPYPIFGGQIAAQALWASGQTVDVSRLPNSLHGYFVRQGVASRPVEYQVSPVRDGRAFSSRRVVALQDGETLFTMLSSFHADEASPEAQVREMPAVGSPEQAAPLRIPRLLRYEGRRVEQQHPHDELPTRFWARCTEDLGEDRLLNACALTYLSDYSAGIAALDTDTHRSGATLDHAMWLHRPVDAEGWTLVDLTPQSVAGGRGWYSGSIFSADGSLVASLAQETLFRSGSGPYFPSEPHGPRPSLT